MNNRILERAILAALGCGLALTVPAAFAADDALAVTGSVTAGVQNTDANGDEANLQRHGAGLRDEIIVPRLELSADEGQGYLNLLGIDLGQDDQFLGVELGKYGTLEASMSYDQWYRDYSDGAFLGTRTRPGYWAVDDAVQRTLEPLFPLTSNPSPAAASTLLGFLADAKVVDLYQQRTIIGANVRVTPLQGLGITAGYTTEDREGQKAIASGSYRRAATGATTIGGLGENFRSYGQEVPMPLEYRTTGVNIGLDYQISRFYFEVGYAATEFNNEVNALTYENPLRITPVNGQVGSSPIHRSVLAPDYDSSALSAALIVSDLPLRSKISVSYAQDSVTQDDAFYPLTANPGVLDDTGAVAANLPLPAKNLDGDVETTSLNAVISSRPFNSLAINLRYNSYDYANDSARIEWTGWVGIGETTWKDYDGSVLGPPVQAPYYNRVPEYERTRYGADAVYSLGSSLKFKGEYWNEDYDRNGDRYADTTEDTFRLSVQWMFLDWGTVRVGYRDSQREIDGEYHEHLDGGVQEEWAELRMFDQADRDREGFDVYLGVDPLANLSIGLSVAQTDDTYDEEFYGLHEGKSMTAGVDMNWAVTERISFNAYYSYDKLESDQLNRTKSNALGGGSFAVPENDWQTEITDESDAYGLEFTAALIPDKLEFFASADFSKGTTETSTSNPDFLAGTTVSGAIGYDWPDVEVETTQIKAGLDYQWNEKLSTALTYLYLEQDIDDFATDGVSQYYGPGATDAQGNQLSHFIFMDANPDDYDANVFMLTLTYGF
jgi:MtrB/PioB family decaheme-associated outer membrane protein